MSTSDYNYTEADTVLTEGYYRYTAAGNAATIVGYTGNDQNLVIPETLGGVTVRYIAERAFYQKLIGSAVMPSTLYSIGNLAFFGCTALESVELNENLAVIGFQAFDYTGITEIELPSGLLECGSLFPDSLLNFSMDGDGKYYRVRDGVLYHFDGEWRLCSYPRGRQDEDFTVPDGVVSIEAYAFYQTKLKNVTVAGDVTGIERGAFMYNNSLESIVIGAEVSDLASQAFMFSGGKAVNVELWQSQAPKMGGNSFSGSSVFSGINSGSVFHCVRGSENTGWNNMPGTVLFDLGSGDLLLGYTLSISDEVYFNYYMKLTDGMLANPDTAYVEITDSGRITQIPVSAAEGPVTVDGETCYRFKYAVPAKNMADDITAVVVDETGGRSTTHTFSVESYLEYIYEYYRNSQNSAELKTADLARALLNFGGFAQTYFGYGTGHLANHSLYPYDVYKVTAGDLSDFGEAEVVMSPAAGRSDPGIRYYGNSLILKSNTAMRLYFMVEDGNALQSVTVDGTSASPSAAGALYYVTVSGISGNKLAQPHTVIIDSACGSVTVTLKPMNYAYTVLNGENGGALVNLMKAMYVYYEAAAAAASAG